MKYLAVLGRLSDISLAELSAYFGESVKKIAPNLAVFESDKAVNIDRFGGALKFGRLISEKPIDYLLNLNTKDGKFSGKFTIGVSDYSKGARKFKAQGEALKIKRLLSKNGRSARVLQNTDAALSTATSHHNQMGEKDGHVEFLINGNEWYVLTGVQNITAYKNRDQARPARDAKVGMLPPKLAQILVNLCGPLDSGSRVLDPFCGTGVVLQEATLDGYKVYGTDLSERMIEYSEKNLKWLSEKKSYENDPILEQGDATSHSWKSKIDAVACETYLGIPMSTPPADIKLKEQKQECKSIILGFLKNISSQIEPNTPLALAVPAWLRPNGHYERLNILDEIEDMGYNVVKLNHLSQEDMLYFRDGQIVAREIILLRKK
jgi:tRNA (guanine10-N2)-dimethyltransferase